MGKPRGSRVKGVGRPARKLGLAAGALYQAWGSGLWEKKVESSKGRNNLKRSSQESDFQKKNARK